MDARNHGDSPHSPDVSYEAMSQDLQDLLPQLGLVPCVLIGHSMGGKTAMLLALQRVGEASPASSVDPEYPAVDLGLSQALDGQVQDLGTPPETQPCLP